ncbi:MAG: hypothetical protein JO032_14730 [Alphaproteobacteria bacterium]|nr:hypothetical protein [Alphaproteobacteria bacterium]
MTPYTLAAGALLFLGSTAYADEVFQARTAITLPGTQKITSFDISYVDPVIGLYLLADRTNKTVDLVDTTTNTVLTQLTATPPFAGATPSNDNAGPDGVIVVNHREVWAGDGPSQIKVIDLFSQKTTHIINTGGTKRADELCFDPRDQLVMMANDADTPPFVTIISTRNYTVLQTIAMDGQTAQGGKIKSPKATNGIEQCQWDRRTGKFYVNIPEVNGAGDDTSPGAVVVISPETLQIEDVYNIPLSQCAGPQGMTVGPDHQILLGCNDPKKTVPSTVAIDDRTGKVIATIRNEDGADEIWFNEGDSQYFLARSGGTNPQQLGVIDASRDDLAADQSVPIGLPNNPPTSPHGTAHSVAADPVFNQVYVPIPSTAGLTVCSQAGGNDAQGCIAVFTAAHDDPGERRDREARR